MSTETASLPRPSRKGLFTALIVAALFSEIQQASTWRKFFAAFGFLLGILRDKSEQVSLDRYQKRLECCRKCPLFYPALSTCGTPLADYRDSQLGCWCHMPTKSRFDSATCWLDEHLDDPNPASWKSNGVN